MLSRLSTITRIFKIAWITTISLGLYDSVAFSQSLYNTDLIDSLKDADNDGVIGARDVCNNTPKGIDVDIHGCPLTKLVYFSFNFNVQFGTNSYRLKPEFQSNLKNLADFMHKAPDTLILIEGHTDNAGTNHYNLTLSKKRAEFIANSLTSAFNISASRIKVFGYGEEKPIASNETETGRVLNRRVNGEIVNPFMYLDSDNKIVTREQSDMLPYINKSDLIISFKRNQYRVKSIYYPAIQSLGNVLQENPDTLIIIEGHTDNSGSERYNSVLSLKRANNVAEMINSQFSISKDRLKTLGYGQAFPIEPNTTKDGRLKNRRVSTTVVKKLKANKEVAIPKWTIWSVDEMDKEQEHKTRSN